MDVSHALPRSNPLPIVYLIDFFGKGGGTENQLAILVNNLDRRLFTPEIYTLRNIEDSTARIVNCPIHNLGITKLLSFQALRAVWRFSRTLKRNRVAVLQLLFIDANIVGVIAAMLAGTRTVIISRRDMGWWYHQKRRRVTNLLNKRATHCIANADAVRHIVREMEYIPDERIHVIHNGVPVNTSTASVGIRSRLGIPEDAPLACVVANLKPIKRLDSFLRVCSMVKHTYAHFLIIGQGKQKSELAALAQSLSVESRVHFFSTVDEVYGILRECEIGVLTSESEGLSNVLIEYAVNGLPAVAFDVGGNREVIADGETGFLIPPYDEPKMASVIDTLLADRTLLARMGDRAKSEGVRRFSIDTMTRQHERLYLNAINQCILLTPAHERTAT